MNRRDFLKNSAVAAAVVSSGGGLVLPEIALANDNLFWQRDRVLSIYRPASRERMNIKYFANGQYIQDGYKALCWMMRDVVDGNQMKAMNINLINLLFAQQQYMRDLGRANPELVFLSGYRTPRHNASLEGAATNSRHMRGDAADYLMERVSKSELITIARRFRAGGIGTYSGFIHNDIGPYREWRGR